MLPTTEQLLDTGYGARVFTEKDLARVFGGTPARRYGLVNRALARGEWIRLRRGFYCLGERYRTEKPSLHHIASCIVPMSYLSLESAWSFHGWIPERVVGATSIRPSGRTTTVETALGPLRYVCLRTRPYTFFQAVARHTWHRQPFLVAHPLRALADYVTHARVAWTGLDFLLDGLRFDEASLEALSPSDFDTVLHIYSSRRTNHFLHQLRAAIGKERP